MIPGINVLNCALSVIARQKVVWRAFESRAQGGRGAFVNTYAPDVEIVGSFQPVEMKDIKTLGFDTDKQYRRLWTSNPVNGVQRGKFPDQLVYDGVVYDVVGTADWYSQDGWRGIYCVEAG